MYQPNKKPVQLVKNFFDVPAKKRTYPLAASIKYDGQLCFLRDGVGYSRTGKQYNSLTPLAQMAKAIDPDQVVIGEFMTFDEEGAFHPVNIISGNFRRDEEFIGACCIIHDVIPVADFDAGCCDTEYIVRMEKAEPFYANMAFIENHLSLVRTEEEAIAFANKAIADGEEGACFKQFDAIWQAGKRNELYMKIKGEVSYDLEVVDVEEGQGKYEGTLGKLVCRWTDGRVVKVSGMTDYQRKIWWEHPEDIVCCIVQIDGMCLTPDGMIREPRFKMVRDDKTEADV